MSGPLLVVQQHTVSVSFPVTVISFPYIQINIRNSPLIISIYPSHPLFEMNMQRFSTIDEYIALQSPKMRKYLKELRSVIRKAAPGAEEAISYGMPAFKYHGPLVFFAAWDQHVGFYPGGKSVIAQYQSQLKEYQTSAGTVQLPPDKPVPAKLITSMVKYRVKQNEEKKKLKAVKSSKRSR